MASGTCCSRRRARPRRWCATCTTPRKRRSTSRSSPPTWRTAASTSTTARATRCAPISGASTRCTPRSCGASASSRNNSGYESGDQLVYSLRRLDLRGVPHAVERPILRARKSGGDRLAAGFWRNGVLTAAADQHFLVEAPRVFGEVTLRQALQRLAVTLRPDAALAPAHEL